MSLVLMDCVSEIISLVEELTSVKIIRVENNEIQVQARLELADESSPQHRLMYRADHDDEINYIVASQCAHLIRLYEADQENRFVPVASRQCMMTYLLQIEGDLKHLSSVFGSEQMKHFVFMWYQGVVFQLTKMPPDIMIDRWLYNRYPELHQVQKHSIEKQLAAAVQALDPAWREMTPPIINYSSNMMNYVYFKIMEDLFHADFVGPYHSTVFIMDGRELLKRTQKSDITDDHQGDRKRIDIWAEFLNLSGWFEWVPFSESPGPSNMFSG